MTPEERATDLIADIETVYGWGAGDWHKWIRNAIRAAVESERQRTLALIQCRIDSKWHASFTPDASLQDAFTAGCEITAKDLYDAIGETQRYSRPIADVDDLHREIRFCRCKLSRLRCLKRQHFPRASTHSLGIFHQLEP